MAPITMDTDVLADAAKSYATARNDAEGVIKSLAEVLDTNWGCAGTDSAGQEWASSYDPAAFDAVSAGTGLVNAFGKLHDLLAATGGNHANTEKANKNPPEPPDASPAQLPVALAPTFKGSYGGDTDAPFGWGLISRWLQGHAWPNGDPDKLRMLGTAWDNAAKGLRRASDGTDSAWVKLENLASGEMSQALAQMDLVFTGVESVATQYESLGAACDDWAQKIEDAHQKILHILAGALGVGLVVGGVVGFFTAGFGVPVVEGSVGGAAGAAIVGVLVTFDGAAALAVGATAAAGVAVAGTATQLQPLLEASPTTFNTSTSGAGGNWSYVPPPKSLPGFPKARLGKRMGRRKRWVDDKGNVYEWDYQHGAVEKYSKNGKHLGEFDPKTGAQTKPADPTRSPEG